MVIMMVLVMGAVGCPTCDLSITPKWSPWDVSGASTTASSTIAWCFIHNKWQQASNGNTCATIATSANTANIATIATSATFAKIVLPPHPPLLGASATKIGNSATIAINANTAIIVTSGTSGTIANSTHPPVLSASVTTSCNNATCLTSATIATSANTLKHLKV